MADGEDAASRAKAKENHVMTIVEPFKIDGLDMNALKALCKKIHSAIAKSEDEKYDLEFNQRKQQLEEYEINLKLNDQRGVFVKPALKKVSKTDMKFAKLEQKKQKERLNVDLKSSGKSKYGLDEESGQKRQKSEGGENEETTGGGLPDEEPAQDEEEEEEEEEE